MLRSPPDEDSSPFHIGCPLGRMRRRKSRKLKTQGEANVYQGHQCRRSQSFVPASWTKTENHKEASQGVKRTLQPSPPDLVHWKYCVPASIIPVQALAHAWADRCRMSVSYQYGRPVELQWIDCGYERSSLCVLPERPTTTFTYTRPEDHRDPVPADERFLRACGVRPPDVRDELRVLDR